MLTAYRKEPDVGKPAPRTPPRDFGNDPMGCVWYLLAIVISYFALSAICRVTSNTGSDLDKMIFYGALICFVIMLLLAIRDWWKESDARRAERQAWAKGCQTALLTIVSRYEAVSWWDDYAYRYHNAPCRLELEMNSDQKSVCPNQTIVDVKVDQYVYDRLKECRTVRIYYLSESPLTFLLEEEV